MNKLLKRTATVQVYRARSSWGHLVNTLLVIKLISFSQEENYLWKVTVLSLTGRNAAFKPPAWAGTRRLHRLQQDPGDTYTHTYLSSPPCAYEVPPGRKPMLSKSQGFPQLHLLQIKTSWPRLRYSSPTLVPSDWLVSQTLGLCAFLFYFLPSGSTAFSNPHPSIRWSSISLWPWTIILLQPWTLSRTFISIHLFNGIVNDLRGVNHSQDNGCKKINRHDFYDII